jgi:hypothetical protein
VPSPPAPAPAPPPAGGCGDLDYIGKCDGSKVVWCEDARIKTKDCAEQGKRCAYQDNRIGWNCLP